MSLFNCFSSNISAPCCVFNTGCRCLWKQFNRFLQFNFNIIPIECNINYSSFIRNLLDISYRKVYITYLILCISPIKCSTQPEYCHCYSVSHQINVLTSNNLKHYMINCGLLLRCSHCPCKFLPHIESWLIAVTVWMYKWSSTVKVNIKPN